MKKRLVVTVILYLFLVTGTAFLLYPFLAEWWNGLRSERVLEEYEEAVGEGTEEEYAELLARADEYNRALAKKSDRFELTEEELREYESQLDMTGKGIMATVEIPVLDIALPVYHGTSEEVLRNAVGHIEGSSLPVGGNGTHALISGHRGLPSARLFTDIDKLKEGDIFRITVPGRTLTYQVDRIVTVLPEEADSLVIDPERDLVTLITCTPYGINSHRLLVRGTRIEEPEEEIPAVRRTGRISAALMIPLAAAPVLLLILVGVFLFRGFRKKKEEKSV